MKYLSRRLFIAATASAMAGCATNSFTSVSPAPAGLSLRNTKVYAYSFLDLRDPEFGPSMLDELDRQLTAAFEASAVTLKVLRFRDSEIGRSYALTNGGMAVPIRQTIESNAYREKALGNDYRIVIFPRRIAPAGAWKNYEIRWDLIDVRTDRVVWSSISEGRHLTLWKADEEPHERAKVIVDSVIKEMKKGELI
jgi:hypothetical protein